MQREYRKIGKLERGIAGFLSLLFLPLVILGPFLVTEGEWLGGIFLTAFGLLASYATVYAAGTGRSPEHLKDALLSIGWWPGGP